MATEPLVELIEEFAEVADEHLDALERLDEEVANSLSARIFSLYHKIIRHDEGREALLVLLESHNNAVAGMAAVFSLRYDPERSLPVLKRLSALPGLMGFRATVAVERWDKGEWNLD